MRYLITGGAGFIGSHLADALVAQGHEVVLLDNLSTGTLGNVAHLEGRATMVQGSVLDPLLVDELVEEVAAVVHLAAAVGVRLIVDKPLRSFITNIKGTENVLEAAHRYRRKVLLASTSEVYGKSLGDPFKEDDDRLLGSNKVSRWGYSTSKSVDEILAFAYHRERGLPTVVVRLFNTVGPRQTGAYGMVLPRFAEQAVAGDAVTVYGDGRQTRCFCHVEDVVAALLRLLEADDAEGDVFNVGSTEEVSMIELADRVIAEAASASPVELIPYEDAYEQGFEDMRRRVPDISKIERLIGWRPQKDLDQIIKEVVAETKGAQAPR
ncbi:MAG: GDP-mannose 4,6-dehydratase [Actinomycetota bacterium]|nr:GDP-mannose 4,6-dehydratase [Actinomycetota bacterium]